MYVGYFYASLFAVVILYINIISTLRRIKNDQDTGINTLIGIICSITIFVSICMICGN